MTEEQMYTLLKQMEIPVAYDHFIQTEDTTAVEPPFILYRGDDTNNFKADNKVYYKQYSYIVDLVTTKKDIAKEIAIETLFANSDLPWDKAEDYIESEKIFQIRYFI